MTVRYILDFNVSFGEYFTFFGTLDIPYISGCSYLCLPWRCDQIVWLFLLLHLSCYLNKTFPVHHQHNHSDFTANCFFVFLLVKQFLQIKNKKNKTSSLIGAYSGSATLYKQNNLCELNTCKGIVHTQTHTNTWTHTWQWPSPATSLSEVNSNQAVSRTAISRDKGQRKTWGGVEGE